MESTGEALKIHCSGECKKLLDSLNGYLFEDRGKIPIKGKGELNTYWLVGELEEYKIKRYQARTERRASKNSAKQISKFLQAQKELQKSSLKSAKSLLNNQNRLTPFSNNLIRSTSFDSPKKLRFAADIMHIENIYHSNRYIYNNPVGSQEALREVITEKITSPKKQNSDDSLIFAVVDANETPGVIIDELTASCPNINKEITEFICNGEDFFTEIPCEMTEMNDSRKLLNQNTPKIQITSITPLLSEHEH